MALDNEQLLSMRDLIAQKGLKHPLKTGNAIEVEKITPELGEMIYNETDLFIGIGNSVKNTNETPYRITGNYPSIFATSKNLIKAIWRNLNRYMVAGQVETLLLPPSLHKMLENTKPDNFSFLRGEVITMDSPFYEEWRVAPDARGCFFRQRDERRPEEGGRDASSWVTPLEGMPLEPRHLGSYQSDSVGDHTHDIEPYVSNLTGAFRGASHTQIKYKGKNKYYFLNRWNELTQQLLPTGEGMGEETRPKNICVLDVWKMYDDLMRIEED